MSSEQSIAAGLSEPLGPAWTAEMAEGREATMMIFLVSGEPLCVNGPRWPRRRQAFRILTDR